MYKKIMSMAQCAVLAAAAFLCCSQQAAAAGLTLNVSDGWKNTGVSISAGDTVTIEAQRIIRLQDGISVNSNGEWIYCWNKKYWERGDQARSASGRPVPSAPAGALIFRVGNGQPFFVPSLTGSPGKNYTPQLGVDGYGKLPGNASPLTHRFAAAGSGPLYVSINLPDNFKKEWNWREYKLRILGKAATECEISGRVVDETGKAVVEAEVQAGGSKKITDRNGAFSVVVTKDGNYQVTVTKNGYSTVQKTVAVSLAQSGSVDCGSLLLIAGAGKIAGRVLTDDGAAAYGAAVQAGAFRGVTDKNGNFIIVAKKGAYQVKATKILPNGMTATGVKEGVDVQPGQDTNAGNIIVAPTIAAGTGWLTTSRVIQKGQTVVIKAGGELELAPQKFGPAGMPGRLGGAGSLMPRAPWGSLVAKLGAGAPFLVGAELKFKAAAAGRLYFGVNVPAADRRQLSGSFSFDEMTVLDLGDMSGAVRGTGGKPLALASVELSGIKETFYTDANGKFQMTDLPANRVYRVTITFPGYSQYIRNMVLGRGASASLGNVTLRPAPITGTALIKLLPKTGATGGLVPVFVEVTNTSVRNGLWSGYLVSLKARSVATGKEYAGMSPTYLVLQPWEKKGTELICHLPVTAPPGNYIITAELRAPETVSIQNAAKTMEAKKELEDKLAAIKEVKGRLVGQNSRTLRVVAGNNEAAIPASARLLLPTITPKVFSPKKGQLVTGKIALREKSVILLGKEIEIFKNKDGDPLLIWNSYEGLYLSSREDGDRKNDWVWIGQSNVQSNDFTVEWDTSKFQDGDYLIRATMKTTYDNKPIEGSMTVMVKVRNDPRPGVIRGKVTDEAGRPLRGVAVRRLVRGQTISGMDWDTLGTQSEVGWEAEDAAVTNYYGDYAFSRVLSGDSRLHFSLDKYADATKELVLKPGQALAVPPVALAGAPCRVSGQVALDDGAPAAGAALALSGPSGQAVQAGEGGKFAFEGLKPGSYRLEASMGEYDPAAAAFACAPGEERALQGLLLKRKLYLVAGAVKDTAGNPLAEAAVTLDKTGPGAVTDNNGRFSIPNVRGGAHTLAFSRVKYENAEAQFETPKSTGAAGMARTVEVNAVMKPAKGALAGKVIPAAAQLFIDDAEIQLANGGRYEAALEAGEHTVRALKKAFETFEQKVSVGPGEILAMDIKLTPARGGFKLTIEPKEAQVMLGEIPLEVKNGAAAAQVPPGKYKLTALAPERITEEREVEITSEQETSLVLALQLLPGGIQGTVEPAQAKLEIDGEKAETDKGAFRKELAPGKHTVTASHGNLEPYQAEVEVAAGEFKQLSITLAKKAELALAAGAAEVLMGQPVTLSVQTPEPDTEVELYSEKGQFLETEKNIITGRSDSKGKFTARWAAATSAKHKIKVRVKKAGKPDEERETEVDVKYATPELDAVIKSVRGYVNIGQPLVLEAQIRNTGKVDGKYRFEMELRGTSDLPFFSLKPEELDLNSGESKTVKFNWNVGALGAYAAKLTVYLVGDKGELKRVSTFQGILSFTALGEMAGKIQVVGGKVIFSPQVRGVRMMYQMSDPGNLGLKNLDGKDVEGQCKVLKQVGNKGEAVFTRLPKVVK